MMILFVVPATVHVKEMRVLSLLLFLTVCWCALTADKLNCSKGVIEPEDPYVLENQNLELVCWRKDGVRPRYLYFSRGSNREPIDEAYQTRNETSVTLRMPVTADEVANHTTSMAYYCHDKRSTKDVCIYNVYVEMDYYPIKATDVKCIGYNWKTMTCSWDLVVDYNNANNVDVSCLYVGIENSDVTLNYRLSDLMWHECPNQNKTHCNWERNEYIAWPKYFVKIIVQNTVLGINMSTEELMFETKNIVVPAPIRESDIEVTYGTEPETVIVQWNHTLLFRKLLYDLSCHSACDPERHFKIPHIPDLSKHFSEQTPAQITLTGLYPYTLYTVTVRSRPLGGNGPWSNGTKKFFTTLPQVPRAAPSTRDGFFEELTDKCSINNNSCRIVKIYFEPLGKCERFSDTAMYNVSTPLENRSFLPSNFSAKVKVPRNMLAEVELRAFSEEGTSTNFSSLGIYPGDQRLRTVQDLVVRTTSGSCTASVVTIENDLRFENISHTIVWCKREENTCQEPLEWYQLGFNETEMQLPMKDCDHNYHFGLTSEGKRISTGDAIASPISWMSCIYHKGKDPEEPLQDVSISWLEERKFKVSWTAYSCLTQNIDYVEFTEIAYCPVLDATNCSCDEQEAVTVRASPRETSELLELNTTIPDGTMICVLVRAKTWSGYGPSVTKNFTIEDNTEVKSSEIGITIGVTLGIVIIIAVIICRRYYKKHSKEQEINLPEILVDEPDVNNKVEKRENHTEEEAEHLNSDSGTGSLSTVTTDNVEPERTNGDSKDIADDVNIPLMSMIDDFPTGSGNYGQQPDLDLEEYDFGCESGVDINGKGNNQSLLGEGNESRSSKTENSDTSVMEEADDHCKNKASSSCQRSGSSTDKANTSNGLECTSTIGSHSGQKEVNEQKLLSVTNANEDHVNCVNQIDRVVSTDENKEDSGGFVDSDDCANAISYQPETNMGSLNCLSGSDVSDIGYSDPKNIYMFSESNNSDTKVWKEEQTSGIEGLEQIKVNSHTHTSCKNPNFSQEKYNTSESVNTPTSTQLNSDDGEFTEGKASKDNQHKYKERNKQNGSYTKIRKSDSGIYKSSSSKDTPVSP